MRKSISSKLALGTLLLGVSLSGSLVVNADGLEGVNLDGISTVSDASEYIGLYGGCVYAKTCSDFCFIYSDGTDLYWYDFVNSTEDVDKYVQVSKEELATFVSDSTKYASYSDADNLKYTMVNLESNLMTAKYQDFYIFTYENNQPNLIGYYDDWNVPELDLSYNELPTVTAKVTEKSDDKAVITVSYAMDEKMYWTNSTDYGVSSVVLKSSGDSTFLGKSSNSVSGEVNFDVYNNDTYTARVYVGFDYVDTTVEVDCIKDTDSTEELTDEEKKIANDSKKPKVTFSKLPKSELTGILTEITIYTDEPSMINFNGETSDGYVTEMKVNVQYNGNYVCNAVDKAGNSTSKDLKVSFFSDTVDSLNTDRDTIWGDEITIAKLPQTGGINIAVYIGIGAVLVVGGIVVLVVVSKKKKGKGDNEQK